MTILVLVFADYTKPFLLETDASKERFGAVLSKKHANELYHPVVYGSQAQTAHEKNYLSSKLKFLALKGVAMEHMKEYILYQPLW